MAYKAILHSILLVFCISIVAVHSRILTLNSSSDDDQNLISDGDDETLSTALSCDHQYGFLPCAENAWGYIFQIFVYQGLLIFGGKQIEWGSKVLFEVFGVGKVGGIIFRILMALPSMMLMIVSGAFSSNEIAQSLVSVGVGIYAGITVFSLTAHWGVCVFVGRRNLKEEKPNDHADEASNPNCLPAKKKLIKLKDEGVKIDVETRKTGGIMLLSLIPYVIVQLVDIFHSSSANRVMTLIALIVSALSLISYFIYQASNTWIQERSLEYSKIDWTITEEEFVDGMVKWLAEIKKSVETRYSTSGNTYDDKASGLLMQERCLDYSNSVGIITEDEFIQVSKRWTEEANSFEASNLSSMTKKKSISEFERAKRNVNEEPNMTEIMRVFSINEESEALKRAKTRLQKSLSLLNHIQTLLEQFNSRRDRMIKESEEEHNFHTEYENIVKKILEDFGKDNNSITDVAELVEQVRIWLNKSTDDRTKSIDELKKIVRREPVYEKRTIIISYFQVLLGILMLTFLGGPLTTSILQLSYATVIPSFSISFVIVPLAMNTRALITALLPASQKNEKSASLTFSEIYGGVIMNNIAGLTTLLFIVYFKELTWDFSTEVLTILFVCAVVGFMAFKCSTYPLWTCILAFLLYPISLGFYCFAQVFWGWN